MDSAVGVIRAWVALSLAGLPGVWKARSALSEGDWEPAGGVVRGLRTARAPPRGRYVFPGPHIMG